MASISAAAVAGGGGGDDNAAAGRAGAEATRGGASESGGEQKKEAMRLKQEANKFYAAREYEKAEQLYSQAIDLDKTDHTLFGNRSAALSSMYRYEDALADAEHALKLKPDWVKGYHRRATALVSLGRLHEASEAYVEALEIEPENKDLKRHLRRTRHSAKLFIVDESIPASL